MTLPPKLEALVKEKIASGRYSSSAQVIEEALHLLDERDRLREMRLEKLREEIAVGLEQLDRGEYVVLDEEEMKRIAAEGRRRLEAREQRK